MDGTTTRRQRLAPWLAQAASIAMIIAIAGGLYEFSVLDPAWPDRLDLIQPARGGVNRKVFWIPLHAVLTLLLPLALWASWRTRPARNAVLLAIASYAVMRAWTGIYFVPAALRFEEAAEVTPALLEEARRWAQLSMLRAPLDVATAAALWIAARRLPRATGGPAGAQPAPGHSRPTSRAP
jgi:hypothetical protein